MTLKKFLSSPVISRYNDALFLLTLCVTVTTFTFSVALNIITLAGYSFCFIVDYRNIKNNLRTYFNTSRCILLLIIFCSMLLSWIYSDDKANAFHELIKFTPFVLLPLTLLRTRDLSPFKITLIKRLYFITCLLAAIICLVLAVYDSGLAGGSYIQHASPGQYATYFAFQFTYHQLSDHLHLHAIYFALLIAVAAFFVIEELKNGTGNKILYSLLLVFFIIMMLLLKATSVNFAFYSFLLCWLYFYLSFRKWTHYVVFLGLAFFSSFAVAYLFTLKSIGQYDQGLYLFDKVEINKRIISIVTAASSFSLICIFIKLLFKKKYSIIVPVLIGVASVAWVFASPVAKNFSDSFKADKHIGVTNINARFGSWTASWMIIKRHPLLGVGIGDERPVLMETYKEIGFNAGIESNFDAHSQYFQFWINSGILAFLAFLALLFIELYKGIRNKNFLLAGFVYCCAILCIFEVLMNAQLGRLFFLFFICTLDKPGTYLKNIKSVSVT